MRSFMHATTPGSAEEFRPHPITAELENSATDAWLDGLDARSTGARHEDALKAIDVARDELGA
jgi:post-segregation antitoxin (ccd killing protein)